MSHVFWKIAAFYTFLGVSLGVGWEGAESLSGEQAWIGFILKLVSIAQVFQFASIRLPRLPGRLQPPWPDVVGIIAVSFGARAGHIITSTDKRFVLLAICVVALAASTAVRARKRIAVAPSIGGLKNPGA